MPLVFLCYLEFKKHLIVPIKNQVGTLLIRYIKKGVPPFSANTKQSLTGIHQIVRGTETEEIPSSQEADNCGYLQTQSINTYLTKSPMR